MKGYLLVIIVLLLAVSISTVSSIEPKEQIDVKFIVDKVDRLFRSETSQGEVQMEIINPHWQRTLKMKVWTQGLEKTFIYIEEPRKDRGTATLRVGDEMWNYFPNINKVMKVPPSMMMGSWMGSNFTNDDLVKETTLLDDYEAELFTPDDAEDGYYYIKLIPKENTPSVWGKIIVKVRKEDYIPVQQDYYDEKGELIRSMYLKDIKMLGGKKIPAVMEMVPHKKENEKTVIEYLDVTFDKKLDDDIFTLRNLRKNR